MPFLRLLIGFSLFLLASCERHDGFTQEQRAYFELTPEEKIEAASTMSNVELLRLHRAYLRTPPPQTDEIPKELGSRGRDAVLDVLAELEKMERPIDQHFYIQMLGEAYRRAGYNYCEDEEVYDRFFNIRYGRGPVDTNDIFHERCRRWRNPANR